MLTVAVQLWLKVQLVGHPVFAAARDTFNPLQHPIDLLLL